MRVNKLAWLAPVTLAVAACTSITPQATQFISIPDTPLPGSSVLPSLTLPTLPVVSIPPASILPATEAPSLAPTQAPPTPSPTPKPTKKPTPTPEPTPTPTPLDLNIYVNTPEIPNWAVGMNNIDVYVTTTVAVPSAHVKITMEDLTIEFDSPAIDPSTRYVYNAQLNLDTSGAATLNLQVKAPSGFVDVNKGNNKVSIAATVAP